jgi:aspartate dehydrogenase
MTHLALIGQGAIARALVPRLREAGVTRLTILVRPGRENATQALASLFDGPSDALSDPQSLLALRPALAVEAAGQDALRGFGPMILSHGIPLIAASVGALADDALYAELRRAARAGETTLHLPSGAIGGLDALAALASAGAVSLTYTGTKPPEAWPEGSPRNGVVFDGSARDAARRFPKNANVAAALALAGPGLDATRVRLLSDPAARGNTHAWEASGDAGRIAMTLTNTPVAGNAATSLLTVHSLLREIRNHISEVSL